MHTQTFEISRASSVKLIESFNFLVPFSTANDLRLAPYLLRDHCSVRHWNCGLHTDGIWRGAGLKKGWGEGRATSNTAVNLRRKSLPHFILYAPRLYFSIKIDQIIKFYFQNWTLLSKLLGENNTLRDSCHFTQIHGSKLKSRMAAIDWYR
jgi:hypothetical protein